MKKLVCLTLVLVMALSLIAMPASAAFNPRYVGTVYASNSTCYINNMPIDCYVMDGYMFIQVEDLNNYGFNVVWNSYDSTLRIMKDDNKAFDYTKRVFRPYSYEIGEKLFDMSTTYVRTFIGNYAYEIECLTGKAGCTYINVDNLSVFGQMTWVNEDEAMYITTSNPGGWAYPLTIGYNPYKVPECAHNEALEMLGSSSSHYYQFSYEKLLGDLHVYFGQYSERNSELTAVTFCYGTFYVDVYDGWNNKVYSTSKNCGYYEYNWNPSYLLGLSNSPVSCMVTVPEYVINNGNSYRVHATFWCDECCRGYEREFYL